jgi:hypothetical protein
MLDHDMWTVVGIGPSATWASVLRHLPPTPILHHSNIPPLPFSGPFLRNGQEITSVLPSPPRGRGQGEGVEMLELFPGRSLGAFLMPPALLGRWLLIGSLLVSLINLTLVLALLIHNPARRAEGTVARRVRTTGAVLANRRIVLNAEKHFDPFVSRLHGSPVVECTVREGELPLALVWQL